MNKTIVIRARGTAAWGTQFDIKSLGAGMKHAVEKQGGTCLSVWAEDQLTVAIQGVTPAWVAELVAAYVSAAEKAGYSLSITQSDSENLPGAALPPSTMVPGAIIFERLTRKFLESLPSEVYVVSNCMDPESLRPILASAVGDFRTRAILWGEAVRTGAAQRRCHVVWNEADFLKLAFPDVP